MTAEGQMPSLSRVSFFDGQRLTAADLADVQARDRQLRWLHNRSLHAWGVAHGLGVTGPTGDREVVLAPGYGTDCLGREIVLDEPRVVPVPPVAGSSPQGDSYYLVAAYAEDADLDVDEQRAGVCAAPGAVRRREGPLVFWRRAADQGADAGEDLLLAQVWVRNCKLARPVSLGVRRLARVSDQPYLASGTTPLPAGWVKADAASGHTGVSIQVETSAARFGSTPRYIAHVVGPRFDGDVFLEGIGRVTDATPTGFMFRLTFLHSAAVERLGFVKQNWRVTWLGVEL